MRVLLIGAYGFLGAECARALLARGHEVVGIGRDVPLGRRLLPDVSWRKGDLRGLTNEEAWEPLLEGVETVVNAAGALQDGPGDDLFAVHVDSVRACLEAAGQGEIRRFVQISAAGASRDAATLFLRTKGQGDALVRASALDWTIFKPGLVLGRNAYGGTALLRMLAAFPFVAPLAHARALVQTVSEDDVAAAVVAAVEGAVPSRCDYDLVEDSPHTLRDLTRALRARLGFAAARVELDMPQGVVAVVARLADAAGALGWRSPLRSTAMTVLRNDVRGDPAPWRAATGRSLKPMAETLRLLAPTAQERAFARLQLLLPLMIGVLSLFWIASGLIGAARADAAAALLSGMPQAAALALVHAGAAADLAIGALLLIRRAARGAAIASVLLAAGYLVAGTVLTPALWADPLGPFVKVIPAMTLGLVVAFVLEKR